MPAIKKRITAEYLEREQRNEENGGAPDNGDKKKGDNGAISPVGASGDYSGSEGASDVLSPVKRKSAKPQKSFILKGLDSEVLIEKRKRTLAPAEQKLDTWLDDNLEKKAESSLPILKLYKFYTDSCQQDGSQLVEMDHFKTILHNKFGKEFALKEASAYSGLVKEGKPRKKPTVVAPSLNFKLKELIDEALKASGNPSKGMIFSWVKKFIAGKYPALQIELRPQVLKKALEREVYAGRVELVKGIGLCGYYRQPGPPTVEEEPKGKKKSGKTKEGESGDSAEDGEDLVKESEDSTEDENKEDMKIGSKKNKKTPGESEEDQKEEGEEDVDEEKKDGEEQAEGKTEGEDGEKKKKKRKKQGKKTKSSGHHSGLKTLNDIFPLAMTYMAEPKEASFVRIRKYLERYYDQTNIDAKLKDCMEKGIKTGVWERVSGAGATGRFQLVVDSFNPSLANDLEDMVSCAIVASNEPKTASIRLLKSYISDYHPEFNIDRRPFKLKKALERAEASNQLKRISGIGLSGSFQLVEQFIPSPAILAGNEDDDDASDYNVNDAKEEVYVIRKTKSGRRAPLERTQLDFSSTYKKGTVSSGGGSPREQKRGKHKPATVVKEKRSAYAESSEEEEAESEERVSDVDEYRPTPSKSRGGSGRGDGFGSPSKRSAVKSAAKAPKIKVAKRKKGKPGSKKPKVEASRSSPVSVKSPRKAKGKKTVSGSEGEEENDGEESEDTYVPPPPKSKISASIPVNSAPKQTAKKRARPAPSPAKVADKGSEDEDDDEEDYFVVEEEPGPRKKGRPNNSIVVPPTPAKVKSATTKSVKRKKISGKLAAESPVVSPGEGRTPRSASQAARKSLKEVDSGAESDDEYVARPSSTRGSGGKN